jgi:tetratricopeptide (TPR) repeat protein
MPLRAALAVTLCALCACGGAGISAESVAEIRAALDSDPSRALALVNKAAAGDDVPPRLALLGAEACLRLDRRDQALDWAQRGLEARGLDAALECELLWAQGTALAGRYQELHAEADRRLANALLERATEAGPRVADAAFLLVMLQDLGAQRDDARQLRFARLLFEHEPDSARARQVRGHLEAKGLVP